ncbi:MAG: methyltransferase [Paracoccaceae bacterium]
MFTDADLSRDAFLGGRILLWQPLIGYRAATDPVLLAAACPAAPGQSVLDLGCGAGTAALCLAARIPGLTLTGLELQPAYAALARRNATENAIQLHVIEGDFATTPLSTAFDQIIANPPYYPRAGSPSPTPSRDTANRAETPITEWIAFAARRLTPGGWLTMICGTDSLPEILSALPPKLGSAVVLPLAARADRPALRIILRARKGGRAAFRLLAPLILHQGAAHDSDRNSYTPKANAILRDAADLSAMFG